MAEKEREQEVRGRKGLVLLDGTVLVGGDGHYWPGGRSTAHRAFVQFCEKLCPSVVVYNGDAFDGASISRFPPIGWNHLPTVKQELDVCKERLGEIADSALGALLVWTLGNHDRRFETRLAQVAPEFRDVHGISLSDHFDVWQNCWSLHINSDVVIKHRFKGGAHAPYNNALHSGVSIITSHLHSQKVVPFSDYRGTRYGVDTGCLADPAHEAFADYTENNPLDWRAGFAVLTFRGGSLLMPELVSVWDEDRVQFRGELIEV